MLTTQTQKVSAHYMYNCGYNTVANYVQKSEIILLKVRTEEYKKQQDWAAYRIQQTNCL